MSENIKIALIISATAIICVALGVGLNIYFSPFNTCTRELEDLVWCLDQIKAEINLNN